MLGTVEVRNSRWMLCRDCYPGMSAAFAPLKEICPDRATPELMELRVLLGSKMPYRQVAKLLTDLLPIDLPRCTHKRTIKIGERVDHQIVQEIWRARAQVDERHPA
ncbi:hypothetical protein REMIM1_PE00562 (plasmid) [Rhizobium etli bv. mimosae str. Mim1]|nr:hypothetical protein REMIM1_PE00562 [Rhizobium etli bv. mimosae str. Mim1]